MLVGDGGSKHDPSDEVVGNPIHAFNLVKRFVVDWKKIEKDLSTDDWKETAFKIKKRRLKTVLPKEDDLHQSAQVILTKTYTVNNRRVKRHFQMGRQETTSPVTRKRAPLFMGDNLKVCNQSKLQKE